MPAAVGAFLLPSLAGTLTASVVGGAIVGAAIGGITAAITGGDIGKGLLFGAIGGAVTGAVSYGLSNVLGSLGTGADVTFKSQEVAGSIKTVGGLTADTSVTAIGGLQTGTDAVTQVTGASVTAADAAGGSGFLGSLGKSLGEGFGVAAVSAGVGGIKDMYLAGKQQEFTAEQSQLEHERALERMEKQAELSAKYSSSGGGGASGPDYTIDELILRDRKAAEEERTSVLAKVGAELGAQKELKQQEFDELAAARGRASEGALVSTGGRGRSTSTESLVDVQNRIRAGEDAQGNPNIGVIPPVEYVPPEQVA